LLNLFSESGASTAAFLLGSCRAPAAIALVRAAPDISLIA
jgi:hypothetical protein